MLTHESVWIKRIIKQQCTDTYLNEIFLYYENRIDYISQILVEASFVWAVLIIGQFSFFITRNKIGDLSSNVVQQESVKEPSIDSEQFKVIDKEQRI